MDTIGVAVVCISHLISAVLGDGSGVVDYDVGIIGT